MLDVISPCVTFNDHEGSTKSYSYMKDHEEPLHELDFVPFFEEIEVEIEAGTTRDVVMHDGSHLRLKKLADDYDASSKIAALRVLDESNRRGEVVTGLLYLETGREDFLQLLNIVDEPLAHLNENRARPPESALLEIMEELR
jgi:2-oxoglutarate ferredoxin oxidoreductase subunit beta